MNELVTSATNQLTYNPEQIQLIKNTVAKGATDDELKMFLYLAKTYNLDPFLKEIWFTKYNTKQGSQTNIMTSRDGYLKYAQGNADFEGLISFVVHEGDIFEIDAADYKISHKFGVKRGRILGAWARCDRKGKKPFISYVEFNEYNQNNSIWSKYPSAMVQKVAESFVLKRAFGINGLVTKEELADASNKPEPEYIEVEVLTDKTEIMINKEQMHKISDLMKQCNIDIATMITMTMNKFDKKTAKDLTYSEAEELIIELESTIVGSEPEEDAAAEVDKTDFSGSPLEGNEA